MHTNGRVRHGHPELVPGGVAFVHACSRVGERTGTEEPGIARAHPEVGARRQGQCSGQSRPVDRGADQRVDETGPASQGISRKSRRGCGTHAIADNHRATDATSRGLCVAPCDSASGREPHDGNRNRDDFPTRCRCAGRRLCAGCRPLPIQLLRPPDLRVRRANPHPRPPRPELLRSRPAWARLRTRPRSEISPAPFPSVHPRWLVPAGAFPRRGGGGPLAAAHAAPRNWRASWLRTVQRFSLASLPRTFPGASGRAGRRVSSGEFPTLAAERLHVFGGNPPTRTATHAAAVPSSTARPTLRRGGPPHGGRRDAPAGPRRPLPPVAAPQVAPHRPAPSRPSAQGVEGKSQRPDKRMTREDMINFMRSGQIGGLTAPGALGGSPRAGQPQRPPLPGSQPRSGTPGPPAGFPGRRPSPGLPGSARSGTGRPTGL